MSQKSIFIDVSVIKKIQEEPSYYTKAKYEIKLILDQYDSARQEAYIRKLQILEQIFEFFCTFNLCSDIINIIRR